MLIELKIERVTKSMLRKMEKNDYSLAQELIGKITRSARQIFIEALSSNEIKKGLIYETSNNKGVFTIIEKKDFIASYITFEKDIDDYDIFEVLHNILNETIENKGTKDLYLNINSKNPSIISYFRQYGFKKDSSGIQYRYRVAKEALEIKNNDSGLEFRGYESEDNDLYIDLLDEAFKSLDIACGMEPYGCKRDRENVINWLRKQDEKEEFGSLWKDNRLVSLYLLSNEYIHTLATHPDYQGKGFGNALVKMCIDNMSKRGYKDIYLNCIDENIQGHRFYEKIGFKPVGWYCENTYRG